MLPVYGGELNPVHYIRAVRTYQRDCAILKLHQTNVLVSETIWRLFQFDIINRFLTDVPLDVHLQRHQKVYFRGQIGFCAAKRREPGS